MKKLSSSESESNTEMTFEEAISLLEQSVRKLEGNSLGLEQSLEEYAKAVGYVTHCQTRLSQAKQKIEQLKSMSKSGETVTVSWEESESKPDTPTTRRRKTEP
ncbi:MAG: exodeoxyribonuclease VII small subunit [Pirellula sp.]|jgi:exodeoxyribonuclease VII small subunit|nr:exodeoxyribonuclease VII small subunit [Pirellula sp.]